MTFEHVPNIVLYNRFLDPPHNTATVPDSPGGRLSGETMIGDGSTGWDWAPLPADPGPGRQAQPVEYAPVAKPKARPASDKTKEDTV